MKELQAILQRLQRDAAWPQALATLVTVEGSSYRRPGARMLVNPAGERLGSISGGCLEADVLERARAVLADGLPQIVPYDTTDDNDLIWGVGLGCQGIAHILIERLPGPPPWAETLRRNFAARRETRLSIVWTAPDLTLIGTHEAAAVAPQLPATAGIFHEQVPPPVRLLIFGAGDDAQPLARLAHELGWRVEVFDARPAYATPARFALAETVAVAAPENAGAVRLDPWTVAVVMTHRYAFDGPILRELLPRQLPYLGLLGPKKRTEKLLADLTSAGLALTDEMRARLHAPVGLDLGGDTPEAVALSALAEIQSVLAGRDARPLRGRARPIHAR